MARRMRDGAVPRRAAGEHRASATPDSLASRAASWTSTLRRLPARSWLLAGGVVLFLAAGALRPASQPAGASTLSSSPPAATPTGAVASAVAAPSASPAPIVGVAAPTGPDVLDLVVKGLLVIALLFLTLRVLKRVQGGPIGDSRRIDVLESRPLAAKASLHLVAIGDRRLLVGLTPAGLVSLTEVGVAELERSAPVESVASPVAPGDAFASLLPASMRDGLRNIARRGGDDR